ncbi:ATP-binding protein [Streptacidiphilus sp. PB12-B1b]|uniref:ATP-binding protein n=1 Tax=Streptacidiphilus sp. PB12-B1b TaxID=2705012 RepID=UPI0015FC7B70|nr:ATP-binding protein [Streptacidiphilus sp. PB12-B1b]QMU74508.1 ATP-binding protein [Streptacidiphilus sp. PB12-B1b]
MDIWWSLHLRREPASVPLARRILLGTMASAGVDPDVSHEVGVALTEACANAVEHAAYIAGSGEDSGFQVTATIEDGRLRVEVTDSGPGFTAARGRTGVLRGGARGGAGKTGRGAAAGPAANGTAANGARAGGGVRGGHAVRRRRGAGIPADAGTQLPDACAESGRGLFLIRALVDHVQFRDNPRSGAVVSFDKTLTYCDRPLLHAS